MTISLPRIYAAISLLLTLMSCEEIAVADRPYQRVLVNDFSAPVRTLLPFRYTSPNSLTLRVSGTISQPVVLTVNYLKPAQGQPPVRRDTLPAGTYRDRTFSSDFYSNEQVELLVTGTPGSTGSLTIEWYTQ